MSNFELIIRGEFLNATNTKLRTLVLDAYKESAEELQQIINREFERSVELGAMVGSNTDPEALRAILRSVKVNVTDGWPPDFNIKFQDDLGHWYGGQELPQELVDIINKIYDSAIQKWSLSGHFENALISIMDK